MAGVAWEEEAEGAAGPEEGGNGSGAEFVDGVSGEVLGDVASTDLLLMRGGVGRRRGEGRQQQRGQR